MGSLFNLPLIMGIGIAVLAFCTEFVDSTLGMGYGTALTPILLFLGFEPLVIVPAVLLSECITGILAAVAHHKAGNVSFLPRGFSLRTSYETLRRFGIRRTLRSGVPRPIKVAFFISLCSVAATIAAVFFAVNLPPLAVKIYIGVMILAMGITILARTGKKSRFSWARITALGAVASFNKGISGGGYGPVVTGGQVLSGLNAKQAIAITSLAEGITCLAGFIVYMITIGAENLTLAPYLIIGAVCSVPLSALTVKKMLYTRFTYIIGGVTLVLGAVTLAKVALG